MLRHDCTARFHSFRLFLFTPAFRRLRLCMWLSVCFCSIGLCCLLASPGRLLVIFVRAEFFAPGLSSGRLLSGTGLRDLGLRGFFFSMLCGDCCVLCLCCLVLALCIFVCVDFGAPRSVVACLCLTFAEKRKKKERREGKEEKKRGFKM